MPATDQGVDDNRYKLVPRNLIFIFDDQERVMLIKGPPQKRLWSGLFNAVGGHIERGEDILESAYRELEEETSITDVLLRFCGQITIDVNERAGVGIFLFRGTYLGKGVEASSEGNLFWKSVNNLRNDELVEDLPLLLPRVYMYRPGDPIIIGKYHYDIQGKLVISLR